MSKERVGDGGVLGMHRLARKHKKQENIEQMKFGVFWKQKKQECIITIRLFVFWNHKKQEVVIIRFVVFDVFLFFMLSGKVQREGQ